MARDFDGANDQLNLGSNASVDGFTQMSVAAWVQRDVDAQQCFAAKDRGTIGWLLTFSGSGGGSVLDLTRMFSGTDGEWKGGSIPINELHHVAIVYDGGATGNAPTIYVDGASVSVTTVTSPTGTADSDAAQSLFVGETGAGTFDYDGAVQNFSYVSGLWTADQVNRAKWWGRPGGAQAVYHPMFTTKLANEGTATADATATGTAVRSLPRVVRPGCGGCW